MTIIIKLLYFVSNALLSLAKRVKYNTESFFQFLECNSAQNFTFSNFTF